MSFAERLKISRKEKGYSQEQLAELLEVSRQSITKWESGSAYPELRKLILLSNCLDRELDWLFFDEKRDLNDNVPEGIVFDQNSLQIHDRRSLEKAMRTGVICRVLEALEGIEFTEENEEDSAGKNTYIVFESRMFLIREDGDLKNGNSSELFLELEPDEALEVLARNYRLLKI